MTREAVKQAMQDAVAKRAGFASWAEAVGYRYADGTLSATFSRFDMNDYCVDTEPSVMAVFILRRANDA